MPLAMNSNQDRAAPRSLAWAMPGTNFCSRSARYSKMALLSNTVTSPSTMAGTLALGFTAKKAGANCSPLRVSTGMASKGRPNSSSSKAIFMGLGAALKKNFSMGAFH